MKGLSGWEFYAAFAGFAGGVLLGAVVVAKSLPAAYVEVGWLQYGGKVYTVELAPENVWPVKGKLMEIKETTK